MFVRVLGNMFDQFEESVKKNKALFWGLVVTTIVVGVVSRCLVATQPYSGMGEAPEFGDFEAQRHWMELTVNLPVREWYVEGPHNNLTYWNIDYPPLTAYFSWAWGKVFVSIITHFLLIVHDVLLFICFLHSFMMAVIMIQCSSCGSRDG